MKIQIEITRISQGIQIKVKDNGLGNCSEVSKKTIQSVLSGPPGSIANAERVWYRIGICPAYYPAHGGKIQFKSRENEGSVFTFYIPEK